jgi:hypothetical protein
MRWRTLFLAPLVALVLTPAFRSSTEAPPVAAKPVTAPSRTPSHIASRAPASRPVTVLARAIVRPSAASISIARASAKPFARPAPRKQPTRRTAPERLMVGPDGIVYERVGPDRMPEPEPEPVAVDKPRRWVVVAEASQQPEAQPRVEAVPAPRAVDEGPAERMAGGVMAGPDGVPFEPAGKSAR